jgi:outer membrane protein OmpA-like peptidoglycan-associated protein
MQYQLLSIFMGVAVGFGAQHAKCGDVMQASRMNWTVLGSAGACMLAGTMMLSAGAQTTTNAPDQSNSASSPAATQSAPTQSSTSQNPQDSGTYATGKPLPTKSNEGFWGHLNPLARKKWVNRQTAPVKDRLNELDQLTAKNSANIKDLDARSTAGIHHAQDTADQASQQASAANTQAGQAQQTAQQASTQTEHLNTTVSNLDQYTPIADTEIRFRPGQTTLNAKAKAALDQVADQLNGQKGYIVEVQGYSHSRGQAGISSSQSLADAVVRYLVVDHNIPVYRIYRVAMGNAPVESTSGSNASLRGSLVHVSLMHNSLAALNTPSSTNGGSSIGATQQSPAQPSPQGAASQPPSQ